MAEPDHILVNRSVVLPWEPALERESRLLGRVCLAPFEPIRDAVDVCVDAYSDIVPHALHLEECHLRPHAGYRTQVINRCRHVSTVLAFEYFGHLPQILCLAAVKRYFPNTRLDELIAGLLQRLESEPIVKEGL